MADNKLTTIQIDEETDRKLKSIATAYERTKAGQLRYWVNREYADLSNLKLLPKEGTVELNENIQ